ncbi:hypothetical protein FQN57_002960 [Myotisia sp. PD_48]|nr:hypothetical protein FQN57_002960 [Myotisia sp. PD_48]
MTSPNLHSVAVTVTTDTFISLATSGTGDGDSIHYQDQTKGQRDLVTQTAISLVFGSAAFLTFCILRRKWRTLYAARRRLRSAASRLPDLPDSMFGWIPVLYKISDEEVLDSAGLDAYVFLSFYQYAIRFLSVIFMFSLVIILPIHYKYTGKYGYPWDGDGDDGDKDPDSSEEKQKTDPTYLWMYVFFTYIFTGIAIHLLIRYTNKIIQVRQSYLGGQTTMTDRTIRLSAIPVEMRSEDKIKEFIEYLDIGKVESVVLCRDWRELDDMMEARKIYLQKLEEAWTKHLGYRWKKSDRRSSIIAREASRIDFTDASERSQLLASDEASTSASALSTTNVRKRPTAKLWYGPLNLRYKSIDAIDYYGEKLRQQDEAITMLRQKEFHAGPLAFVTMESIASCQMAIQAILDPWPMQFVASLAPSPADVVWRYTYLSRSQKIVRGWSITMTIGVLTIFWSLLLVPLAYLLNLETIEKVIPQLAELLSRHAVLKSLVQTGLPTLTLSLLSVAVPYLYDWLANLQGITSQGDVELSVISKNFFFTFFNLFLVFTVFATASNFYGLWENVRDVFKNPTTIAFALARSLETLAPFYTNLIVLQGLGLFPFRLLEFGSVFMYPFQRLSATTPRDYADLEKPPTFSYGFALPHTMLIFIICIVYSVLPSSWLVCLFGLIYFTIGRFIYKYQLLYAMDHQQHSTGRAWPMICSRIILGLVVFQLAMAGILALRTAITRSILLLPLLGGTVWFSYFFQRTYEPLMKFIALRSIDRSRGAESDESPTPSSTFSPQLQLDRDSIPLRLRGLDMAPRLKRYVNPNLVIPLDEVWIPSRPSSFGTTLLNNSGAMESGQSFA